MENSLAFKFMTFSMIHARDDADEKKIIEEYPRWEQYDPTKVYAKGVHNAGYGDGFQKYEHQHLEFLLSGRQYVVTIPRDS